MALAAFMATALGRLIRVIAGIVLIGVGFALVEGAAGWIITTFGAVLIVLAAFNYCVIALLIGAPFSGREALQRQERTRHLGGST